MLRPVLRHRLCNAGGMKLTVLACASGLGLSSLEAQTLPQVVERALQVYPSIQTANAKAQAA
ncbi:hypothetical protein, partial [Xenorhabdus bovienii]|uniref:hypothetical protein n=1 Tax=Xenorhabdus bovienii TaxID=40576 RepID=UPI0023B26A9C